MSTENKPIALNSTLQSLATKMQLVSDALDDTVQSDWAETDATADSYIRNKIETDFWTDATISGNPLSFKTGTAQTALSTKISMEPIQDLHGYDSPWPAGGGVNKYNSAETSFVEGGYLDDNGDFQYSSSSHYTSNYTEVKSNTQYTYSGTMWSGGTVGRLYFYDENKNWISRTIGIINVASYTFTTPADCKYIQIQCSTSIDGSDWQIELGSTATSYYPYSNICPITGRSSVEIDGCGKNIVNYDDVSYIQYNAQGNQRWGYAFDKAGTYTVSCTPSSGDRYLFAKIVNANGTYGNGIYVAVPSGAAAITVNPFTTTLNQGDILLVYTARGESSQRALAIADLEQMQVQVELSESVTPYSPYQSSNEINISFPAVGKNLWNPSVLQNYYINNDGSLISSSTWRMIEFDDLPVGETYSFSSIETATGYPIVICAYDENMQVVAYASKVLPETTSERLSVSMTLPTTTHIVRACARASITTDRQTQFEKGSPTAYEPYTNTVYGGTLDVTNGVLTVDRTYVQKIWSDFGNQTSRGNNFVSRNIKINDASEDTISQANVCICDIAPYVINNNPFVHCYFNNQKYFYLFLPDDASETTVINFIYYLAIPRTIQLTPEQVQLLKGNNTLWTDGDEIELTYINDSKNLTEVNDDFNAIIDAIAPMEKNLQSSTHNYVIGDYMLIKGKLHKVTFPILINGEIIIGTNVTPTTIGEELTTALS